MKRDDEHEERKEALQWAMMSPVDQFLVSLPRLAWKAFWGLFAIGVALWALGILKVT